MMADHAMRGSRLGAVSYETDRNHNLAPRQNAGVQYTVAALMPPVQVSLSVQVPLLYVR